MLLIRIPPACLRTPRARAGFTHEGFGDGELMRREALLQLCCPAASLCIWERNVKSSSCTEPYGVHLRAVARISLFFVTQQRSRLGLVNNNKWRQRHWCYLRSLVQLWCLSASPLLKVSPESVSRTSLYCHLYNNTIPLYRIPHLPNQKETVSWSYEEEACEP